ncbi:MAG: hypothetical protein K9I82_17235 [Chitinophagaceae bacterium]|nr:hypothetical protein [Chitinophagaceae bacterium]
MKFIINLFLLLLISTFTFSQNVRPLSNYFYSIDEDFKWNSFSFKNDWFFYSSQFAKSNENTKSYNFLLNYKIDDDYTKQLFEFKYLPIYENIKFDKSYLQLENDKILYYDKLVFLKSFEKSNDAKLFYNTTKKFLSNKYGIGDSTHHYDYQNEIGRQWWGNNIVISIKIVNEKFIFLSIRNVQYDYYNSIQFKKDYNNLSFDFKQIDNEYSFKGIKFETPLNTLKNTYDFKDYLSSKYNFRTYESNFLNWKSIIFSEYALFSFDKNFNLAEVSLLFDYKSQIEFNFYQNKLINILGQPSIEDNESRMWIGKNIIIGAPKIYNDGRLRTFSLTIMSNKTNKASEKDY